MRPYLGKMKGKMCTLWGTHAQCVSVSPEIAVAAPRAGLQSAEQKVRETWALEAQIMALNFCNTARGPKSRIKQNRGKFITTCFSCICLLSLQTLQTYHTHIQLQGGKFPCYGLNRVPLKLIC